MPMWMVGMVLRVVAMREVAVRRVAVRVVAVASTAASAIEAVGPASAEGILAAASAVVAVPVEGVRASIRAAARASRPMRMRLVTVGSHASIATINAICATRAVGKLRTTSAVVTVSVQSVSTSIHAARRRDVCMIRSMRVVWMVSMDGVTAREADAAIIAICAEGARHVLRTTPTVIAITIVSMKAGV